MWLYATSVLSTTSWLLLTRSSYKLNSAAIAFDVGAAALYLIVFIILGESMTSVQAIGAILALAGMALMSS